MDTAHWTSLAAGGWSEQGEPEACMVWARAGGPLVLGQVGASSLLVLEPATGALSRLRDERLELDELVPCPVDGEALALHRDRAVFRVDPGAGQMRRVCAMDGVGAAGQAADGTLLVLLAPGWGEAEVLRWVLDRDGRSSPETMARPQGFSGWSSDAALVGGGRWLLRRGLEQGTLPCWRLPGGAPWPLPPAPRPQLDQLWGCSYDGRRCLLGGDGRLELWDLAEARLLSACGEVELEAATLAPDGDRVLAVVGDRLLLWDALALDQAPRALGLERPRPWQRPQLCLEPGGQRLALLQGAQILLLPLQALLDAPAARPAPRDAAESEEPGGAGPQVFTRPCPVAVEPGDLADIELLPEGLALSLRGEEASGTLCLEASLRACRGEPVTLSALGFVLRDRAGALLEVAEESLELRFRRNQELQLEIEVGASVLETFASLELRALDGGERRVRVAGCELPPLDRLPRRDLRQRWTPAPLRADPGAWPGVELEGELWLLRGRRSTAELLLRITSAGERAELRAVAALRDAAGRIVLRGEQHVSLAPPEVWVSLPLDEGEGGLSQVRTLELGLVGDSARSGVVATLRRQE